MKYRLFPRNTMQAIGFVVLIIIVLAIFICVVLAAMGGLTGRYYYY
jgi:hypothetical protein